ncbi:glycosyltransferase [Geodermatophilus sp. CPCC 206100]|uniref:glycosyltransferase n=1 Tax=Geodermatophilus sp. CPCC 206100 TaxID=3020054 RepID=UPI003B003578
MSTSVGRGARSLLSVAPLVPAGGVDVLLTAFGLLADDRPELRLEIVGSGPLGRVFGHHALYLGIEDRVDFCGALPDAAVRTAVHGCALLVFPHRSGESFDPSPALVAALDAARPVVATSAAAPPHVLRHRENGLVVPPDDPIALATSMAEVLDRASLTVALASLPWQTSRELPPHGALHRLWHRVTG